MEYATNGSLGSTTTAYSFGVRRESFVETTAGMGAGAAIGGMTYQSSGIYYYTGTGSVANVTGSATNQSYSYTASGSMTAFAMNASATGASGSGITGTSTLTTNPTAYGTYGVYGYNGEYTHTSLGLQYLRARYLNVATGTFTSRDTYAGRMQDILSQNRYTYAENNPVGRSDPSGHAVSTKQRALNATRNAVNAYATQQRAKNEVAQYEALKLRLNASLAKAEQSRAKAELIEKPLEWYQSASAWVDKGLVKVAGYLDSSWSGPCAEAFATWVVEKECQAYDYCVNKIQEAIPGSDGARVLKGIGLLWGGTFKMTGGLTIGALSTTVSWAGIGIPGIFAGTTTAAAGASDIQQGTEEFYLGIIGDSTTKTENGLANMWFGGDEPLYHTTTGIAGFAGNFGIPKLATRFPNNSALINGANETSIAQKSNIIANSADDIHSAGKRYTPDQQALIELAKEAKKSGGTTLEEAKILLGWADEYGVPAHGPEIHPERMGTASNILHFHIGKTGHIPIIEE